MSKLFDVPLNTQTQFILSTSGATSSIKKHNTALQKIGVNLVYFTFNREISPMSYAGLLRSPIVRGGAVTGQGLKSGVIPFLDEIDSLAKDMGVVNTVVNNNGKLSGYNTDAHGFETAITKHIQASGFKINTAAIYGYGGVSSVAANVLKKLDIQTTITGRSLEKAAIKMLQTGLTKLNGPFDLVVNATPISLDPIHKAVGLTNVLKNCKIVFDHNMPELKDKHNYLEEYCKKNRIYFAPGKDMYVPQMIKQWKIFLNDFSKDDGSAWSITDEDIKKYWKT